MAVKLPNGATVHIATALAADKKVTVATNAAECVLTVAGHIRAAISVKRQVCMGCLLG